MECKDRKGMPVPSDAQQDAILRKLYGTAGGRMVLKVLVRLWVSRLGGAVLSSRISKLAIPGFVKKTASTCASTSTKDTNLIMTSLPAG